MNWPCWMVNTITDAADGIRAPIFNRVGTGHLTAIHGYCSVYACTSGIPTGQLNYQRLSFLCWWYNRVCGPTSTCCMFPWDPLCTLLYRLMQISKWIFLHVPPYWPVVFIHMPVLYWENVLWQSFRHKPEQGLASSHLLPTSLKRRQVIIAFQRLQLKQLYVAGTWGNVRSTLAQWSMQALQHVSVLRRIGVLYWSVHNVLCTRCALGNFYTV